MESLVREDSSIEEGSFWSFFLLQWSRGHPSEVMGMVNPRQLRRGVIGYFQQPGRQSSEASVEAGRQAMIAAVVKLVHILEYRYAQPGQLSIAIISFRMGYKMLTQENSNVVLNDTFCHVYFMRNIEVRYHKSL